LLILSCRFLYGFTLCDTVFFFVILRYKQRMEKDLVAIGKRISAIRTKVGLSQGALGERLAVKAGAVSRYENGSADPGALRLMVIANLGGVTTDWLISGEGPGLENPNETSEITDQDLVNLILARDLSHMVKTQAKEQALAQVREEMTIYEQARDPGQITETERQLVDAYRHASEEIRAAAQDMLESSARRSREKDGVGSNSNEANCA
jgi:transcriptional regulator with XRE-family HTH domain